MLGRTSKTFQPLWVLITLATLLPALIIIYLLWRYGVNIPFEDEWDFVGVIQALHHHHFSIGQLWGLHNEHRIFFPQLIMLGLSVLTRGDVRAETGFSLLLSLTTLGLLVWLIHRTVTNRFYSAILGILAAWITLSPVQWENWLWGWQLAWFLVILAVVVTFCAILMALGVPRIRLPWLGFAAAAAIVASYSLGGGICVWPAALIILLGYRVPRRWLIAWIGLGIIVTSAYFIGYHSPPNAYAATLIFYRPFDFLRYFFTLIGRPLGTDITTSSEWGLVLAFSIVASVVYLWRRQRTLLNALPWIALGAFALLASGFTAFSRFGAGVEQAMSSRYYAISSLVLLATIVLAAIALQSYIRESRAGQLGPIIAAVILLTLVMNNYFYGMELAGVQSKILVSFRNCAHTATTGNEDCLMSGFPHKNQVWQHIQYLRSIRWGGF